MQTKAILGGAIALLALVLLAGASGGRRIDVEEVKDLENLQGDQFVVLVYDPADAGLREAFFKAAGGPATFVAIPADLVEQWDQLDAEAVRQSSAVIGLDMRRAAGLQTEVFAVPSPAVVASAIAAALTFLASFEEAELVLGDAATRPARKALG